MLVTLIYDNTAWLSNLQPDWGFSCLIQGDGWPTILFDTGANGSILLANMDKLGIDPLSIEIVFISHGHFDHTGGLQGFLGINKDISLYVPSSWNTGSRAREIITVQMSLDLAKGVHSTGELRSIEQSLVLETDRGSVIITGCSHPGVDRILQASAAWGRPYALIGGLHGFRRFDLLEPLSLICPTHCTMHARELHRMYPQKCASGGAGRRIQI